MSRSSRAHVLSVVTAVVAAVVVNVHARIPPAQRLFRSPTIDNVITTVSARLRDRELARLFTNCLPNTLDTTVQHHSTDPVTGAPDTFIVTGDINATWLRDTVNQVLPYVPYTRTDKQLRHLLCGVVQRQARDILHDAYANAFNYDNDAAGPHMQDVRVPVMTPHVYEGKYELDSLAAFLKLSTRLFNATGDTTCFAYNDGRWLRAVRRVVSVVARMQRGTVDDTLHPLSPCPSSRQCRRRRYAVGEKSTVVEKQQQEEDCGDATYMFARCTDVATDTLQLQRNGPAVSGTTGMSKCQFRPSDDATTFGFHIPANAMTVVELRAVLPLLRLQHASSPSPTFDNTLAAQVTLLAEEIDAGIRRYGIVDVAAAATSSNNNGTSPQQSSQTVFAYEVDGYGSYALLDDANVPSLLSLPYLGYVQSSASSSTSLYDVYRRTRRRLLSNATNPFYFSGRDGSGIGGPHVGMGHVWPMAVMIQALTATNDSAGDREIMTSLATLKRAAAATGYMHESFCYNDVTHYTRPWFAWANSLFGELVLTLTQERPHLVY